MEHLLTPDVPRAPLAMARGRSLALVELLEAKLAERLADLPEIVCVAAAGSLARLESGPGSDLDAIVVTATTSDAPQTLMARVYGALADLPLQAPKAWGTYVSPISVATLLNTQVRGALDEPPADFGRRFQFLLDTRALYGHGAHAALRRQVLDWYVNDGPARGFALLLHDLQRYRHAYHVWQSFKFERDADDGWYLRQAKLGTSRLLGFAGLGLLLGESSRHAARSDWLAERLPLTPLERVQDVIGAYDPALLARVEFHYESALSLLFSPATRAALVAASPVDPREIPAQPPAAYAEVAQHAAALRALLTRFVLARRGVWAPSYYEHLLHG